MINNFSELEPEAEGRQPLLIAPDGTLQFVAPANGSTFELEELQRYVGGFIETLRLTDYWLVINENGKCEGLLANFRASTLAWAGGLSRDDIIVGPALVCPLKFLVA